MAHAAPSQPSEMRLLGTLRAAKTNNTKAATSRIGMSMAEL